MAISGTLIPAIGMVSKRKAKKAAQRIKEHWKRVFPPKSPEVSNRFVLYCQEMVLSDAERKAEEVAAMSGQNQPKHEPVHPVLVWVLRVGGFSMFIGGLGMIRPQFFLLAVFLVYTGLAVLALDLYVEATLRWIFKILGWVIIVGVCVWFSIAVVFVSTPLNLTTLTTLFNYPEAKGPGGISWRPFYTELDLLVSNPTNDSYDDINIVVRPDEPVAAISHFDNLSDVSFEDRFGMVTHFTVDDSSQPGQQLTLTFLATDAGYKVHCGRIPPLTSLKIVMAVVNIKPGRELAPNEPIVIPPNVKSEDFTVRSVLTNKDGKFMYWYGNENHATLYLPKASPHSISVSGSYVAADRRKTINQQVPVEVWQH